jgi:DNA-damage-inducible protein J
MARTRASAVVRARIDENIKREAEAVLDKIGITVSDLLRMTVTRVAAEQAVPFDLKVPNAKTRAAMEEARTIMKRGRGRSIEDALRELDGQEEAGGPKKGLSAA